LRPFRIVLAVDGTTERFLRVCALVAGLFIDQCPVFEVHLARTEGDSVGTDEEIVTARRNGRLSARDLVLKVNGIRGRSSTSIMPPFSPTLRSPTESKSLSTHGPGLPDFLCQSDERWGRSSDLVVRRLKGECLALT
jgi:hypothetical protein